MKAGQGSQTAVMVCMGRAVAHGLPGVGRFSDPTALALLPDEARARVEQFRSGTVPRGVRARFGHVALEKRSMMMVVRTVAIDDAVRACSAPQVVILGAGLDGRAWRMPELAGSIVFEVDHPDSQREKRARARSLTPLAREVRFVPVDFTRDRLDDALAAAGHDPGQPTTWLWEGLVIYLTRAEIESTLAVIQRRSTAGSRLIVAYFQSALLLKLLGWGLKRIGEPLRSVFEAKEWSELVAHFGFRVIADEDLPGLARSMPSAVRKAASPLRHLRLATAERTGT